MLFSLAFIVVLVYGVVSVNSVVFSCNEFEFSLLGISFPCIVWLCLLFRCGWLGLMLGGIEVVFGFGYFEFGFAGVCGLFVVCIGCLILLSVWLLIVDFGFWRFGW